MKEIQKKLQKLSKGRKSNWAKDTEFRIKNKKWLKYSSNIARRILAVIEDNEELNQVKLAEILKVSPQQISKIIKGKENLTLDSIAKISDALGTELISFPEYKYSAVSGQVYASFKTSIQSIETSTQNTNGMSVDWLNKLTIAENYYKPETFKVSDKSSILSTVKAA